MVQGKDVNVAAFGLAASALELICDVFRRHPEVHEVKIFGSRALGRFENSSDIDLAMWGDLDLGLIGRIKAELDELPLPYTFDVQAYSAIKHPLLRDHIDKVGKTVYPRETARSPQ